MNILPRGIEKAAIQYKYFPTLWQLVVWRNWGYVPVERIASVLKTSCANIREAAKDLGLNPNEPVDLEWGNRGFLTIIRNNWHICTYEQILGLLNISEEKLAAILNEEDFMWIKLGELKPSVEAPQYSALTETEVQQTKEIVMTMRERFSSDLTQRENAFEFIHKFSNAIETENDSTKHSKKNNNIRMIYPYFALGDTLMNEDIDPIPEHILKEYAKVGVNGIWMHMILYQLVEFPFDPSISKGWEVRIHSLKKLVAKAKKYGIGIYPYFNEPRAMPESFFQEYPHLRGQAEGAYYAMCTSAIEVQNYLYQAVKTLFEMVPDLAGFFTITMSENLTNCYSRLFVHDRIGSHETECPRCKNRMPWEVVAEVNNLMAKGAHDANPKAKVIAWTWGWPDEWAEKVIPLLKEGQIIQCTSEEALKYVIGGIEGNVLDYSMSLYGPGEKAKNLWRTAKECGMQISAKVQINNTWEMAAVPYIPVLDKVAKHMEQLQKQGIQHLHTSWTLGGCPSPNLRLATWLMGDNGTLMDFLIDWLGPKLAEGVYRAQQQLSNAFSHFPFYIDCLYFGPQNFGPMAPFFLESTGYEATMVGYPYDDLGKWSGIYPTEIYEEQYRHLCKEWQEGVELLQVYKGQNEELDEFILMAEAVLCHYKSAYHHILFVSHRGEAITQDNKEELLQIVHDEIENVQTLLQLRGSDSRIGYESSNHYFYTVRDLKEKLINLAYCEEKLDSV